MSVGHMEREHVRGIKSTCSRLNINSLHSTIRWNGHTATLKRIASKSESLYFRYDKFCRYFCFYTSPDKQHKSRAKFIHICNVNEISRSISLQKFYEKSESRMQLHMHMAERC